MDSFRKTQRSPVVRDIVLLVAAVLILSIPFLNQAYHLDDREFIEFARVQLDHPLQFYLNDYDYAWQHFEVFHTSHPPLLSSLIAVTMTLTGSEAEPLIHGVYLIFPLTAALAMYSLGRRFTRHALAAALLMVVTTGFLVMSHTIRGDVPGLAMWLAAAAVYIRGVDGQSRRLLAAAAVLLVLAVMTSYQCLSLVPLLFFYALVQRRVRWSTMLPLAAVLAFFAAFAVYFTISTGEFIRFSYRLGIKFNWLALPGKGRALLAYIGAATVFPIALLAAMVRSRRELSIFPVVAAALLAAGVIIPYANGDITGIQALLLVPFALAGLAAIMHALGYTFIGLGGWKGRTAVSSDNLFLSVWLLGVAFYVFFLLPYVAVRYMLPLFPPLVLLFVSGGEELFGGNGKSEARTRAFLYGTVILTLLLSLPAAVADYRLANIYRTLAGQYQEEYAGSPAKVWFQGEFGFRYYMDRAGFSYLGASSDPRPGDLVIESRVASTTGADLLVAPIPEQFSVVTGRMSVEDGFPVRTRNPWAEAGFYSHRIGPLPVMPSSEPLDEITFYRFQW